MKKVFKILFIVILIAIFFLRNLSFTAYNIRPVKECSKFLEKTYGRKFRRTREPVAYYMDGGYHVWKIQYVDDTGMEFYEYYKQPYEISGEGFCPYFVRDEWFICDYYWQQQIQRVYGEKFNLEQYRMSEPSWLKYKFEITDENDIKEAANIIAVTLKYTFDNVETISRDMLGYIITYDGWPIYTIYEDREGVLELRNQDEEDIYQYIYNEIYKCYQKEK